MTDALTPMMQQYQRLRKSIPADTLLLFRLGDFYELFFEDAKEASVLLNVALTKRNEVPMCGVPYHAAPGYIAKLIKAGRRVAICDQTSEPQPGKIVSRDITQIISAGTVSELNFDWDVTRPSEVKTRQALFNDDDENGASGDTDDSGLSLLEARSLKDFAGRTMTALLTAPVDDAQELLLRAQSLLREAGWFVRCEGEADVARLNAVLRAGTVVQVNGAGNLHSGKYLVWNVRHTLTGDSHKMRFVLVRNAVGKAAQDAGGSLGGLL